MEIAVLFGGSGFIGSHFSQYLLDHSLVTKVLVVDIKPLDRGRITEAYTSYIKAGQIEFIEGDVRKSISLNLEGEIALIANFAAVHREPGHEGFEYYETNLLGAENVCKWADDVSCEKIIFTSSIAPYGPSEVARDESSVPTPTTAYGGSKLAAEKTHQIWQAKASKSRKLAIVRPGVVFGAGEGGNVSRLVKAILKKYFFYMGNKSTRKAGTYVKELCHAMWWVLENKTEDGVAVFNMSMNPGPTIEEYVATICKVADVKRFIPSVPFWVLLGLSFIIDPIAKILNISQPISPVRIRKLVKSNNIVPTFLHVHNYVYQFTFIEAMTDWKKDKPSEWS